MAVERNAEEEIATKVRPSATAGSSATPAFELVVIEGPDAGAHFPLDRSGPTRLLIGQSPACGVRLSDPHVSRRHAALHHAGQPEVQLTDLGSKNGTAALAAEDDNTPQDFLESVLELDLPLPHSRARLLDELHRRYVERAVTQHGGNIRRAAGASGIAHRYFQILRARNTK